MASEERRNADRVVGREVDKRMRALCLEGLGRLMKKTPVRTGRAKANWNTSAGTPDSSVNEGATSADVEAKRAGGMATILATKFFERDEHLFVTNSLPYIEALEGGHSRRAPEGMVAVTVEELRGLADRIGGSL